jgi:Transposase zinc-binding domain
MHARLGHQRPRTTARETPLTAPTVDLVHAPSTALMAALCACRSTRLPEGADVWRRDGPASGARCGEGLLPSHRRAMAALVHGRTETLGGHLWPCEPGGQAHDVDHAGRHRRGPTGQRQDTEAWLAARRQARLPVPSVHLVCTGPPALGELSRPPQPDLDALLIRAAAPARINLAADPHDVGGLMGVLGVRHPWTRTPGRPAARPRPGPRGWSRR